MGETLGPDANLSERITYSRDAPTPGQYSVINDWLVIAANQCTCGAGGEFGHEPGCGYEPVAKIAEIEAALANVRNIRELAETMMNEQGQGWNSISGRRILNVIDGPPCRLCGHRRHEDGRCSEQMKTSFPTRICDCPKYVPDA